MSVRIIDEFPKTAINRKATDVWTAATRGPVSLSDHGTSRFVLMPRDMFDDLTSRADPRIVRATSETPEDEAEALLRILDEVTSRDD
ncbi:type II toxin-antitoxin system prevent-host-death family antitoxin [uncultured Tateyamaria sp.]|uniref:type II toxin-antitoxin system prevent-host-death family antitoxin n=1 Tax=uncultured Tateyamaria sp. TaxID=455651 RepID=UPI0026101C22|nr:type II toxin-antitoxin system prevent-host-death family antitoxin [uncultured Tateyamaria sp.]